MYESHYGFSEKPFNLTPDPKYLYLSSRHTEAFAHLEFGRRERGGFAVITGEVGTGKTTLARYFLSRIGEKTATAVVLYPALTAAELLRSILDDLHVKAEGPSLKDLVDALHRFLLQARAEGRDVVLLIDEAQDLSAEVLEQIRLISNLETDTEKLIQIVLMGQSELNELLARRDLRQLAQRVSARYHLAPLSREQSEEYIRHRLKVAGGEGRVTFTAPALGAVHRLSTGVPRLINLLCDRALLAGYVQGARTITEQMVRQSAHEIAGQPSRGRRPWPYVGLGAVAALTALAAFLWLPGALPTPAAAKPAAVEAKLTLAVPESAVATPPPPIATTPPGPGPLEGIVLSLPREASFQRSVASVQSEWNGGPVESTSFRTQLEQIRRLDLPVVLEMFHPARKDTCYVALLRLQNEEASVVAGATPLAVPVPELDRYWTRQAFFLWRDYDGVGRAAHPERALAWARSGLSRLGYMRADADLTAAVTRFQQDADLMPDGVVGSRTLMTLYSRGPYPRPRLSAGGGS